MQLKKKEIHAKNYEEFQKHVQKTSSVTVTFNEYWAVMRIYSLYQPSIVASLFGPKVLVTFIKQDESKSQAL